MSPSPAGSGTGLLEALYQGEASIQVAGQHLSGDRLAGAVGAVAASVGRSAGRVAVIARPELGTLVAVAGILAAGATVVPISPAAGPGERDHVIDQAQVDLVLPDVDLRAADSLPPEPPVDESPALILFTSGSTGPAKGAVISRRAVAGNLEALRAAWDWTSADVLAHALPFSHVHGLVFGGLGPLRIGSPLVHTGRYLTPVPEASLYFGVPALWASMRAGDLRRLSSARLLVSGADTLPTAVFDRVLAQAGHRILNRYAMTETLVIASPRIGDPRSPRSVGPPLPGVQVRLAELDPDPDPDPGVRPRRGPDQPPGEVQVRGAGLFSGYTGMGPALDDDGWFATGDVGEWLPDGSLRLIGRRHADLIKSGGYRVGAGEVEEALLAYPGIAEAAVTGVPDRRLGQRVGAWVVTTTALDRRDLAEFLASRLTAYKLPQELHEVDALPRNGLGKIQKRLLRPEGRP